MLKIPEIKTHSCENLNFSMNDVLFFQSIHHLMVLLMNSLKCIAISNRNTMNA